MPDAIHNKNEDYVYFTIDVQLEEEEEKGEGQRGEVKEIEGRGNAKETEEGKVHNRDRQEK